MLSRFDPSIAEEVLYHRPVLEDDQAVGKDSRLNAPDISLLSLYCLFLLMTGIDGLLSKSTAIVTSPNPKSLNNNGDQKDHAFLQISRSACNFDSCSCTCHSGYRYQSPSFLKEFTGQLFLGYLSTPAFPTRCNKRSCNSQQSFSLKVTYCFPYWFLSKVFCIVADKYSSGIWKTKFEVRRQISWGQNDNILRFALHGNVDGVKSLLLSRQASVLDIDPHHGSTALHVSHYRFNVLPKVTIRSLRRYITR
jgi:hypothetical protein